MKPTIGRDVHVLGIRSNGSNVHPGKITRVWDDNGDTLEGPVMVNAVVFPDGGGYTNCSSIRLYDTKVQAEAAIENEGGEAFAAYVPWHGNRAEPGT